MRLSILSFMVTLVLGLLTAPLLAEAQKPGKMARIGYIRWQRTGSEARDAAFLQGLRDLGWIEGQNIAIEYRWPEGNWDHFRAMAAELVRLPVDVIVTDGQTAVLELQQATSIIPIVMLQAADVVEDGLVASFARPGGNVTGTAMPNTEINTKLLELLHETLPHVTRVGVIWNRKTLTYVRTFSALQAAAPALGLTLHSLEFDDYRHSPFRAEELERALAAQTQERMGALLVMGGMYRRFGPGLAAFAATHRMPVFSVYTEGVAQHGGLLGYAPVWEDLFRNAATYVDKILKGAKPADLPVQRPVKYNLVVNLKTAKAFGITIPPIILYQATTVIQ